MSSLNQKKQAPRFRLWQTGPMDFLVLIPMAFLSVILIWYNYNSQKIFQHTLEEQFQSHQIEIVKGAARGIENMFSGLTNSMLTLASSDYVQDPKSEESRELVREFYMANQDFVYAGYRMDRRGVLRDMYPVNELALNADISKQEHVAKLFKTHRLVVSG
jgi:hypothetical protein